MHDYGDDDDDVDDNGENTFSTRGLVEEAPSSMHVAFTAIKTSNICGLCTEHTHTQRSRNTFIIIQLK